MNSKLVLAESLSIFSLLVMLAGRKPALAETPVMEECEPKSCGNGLNISYPFWLEGQQKSYCGYSSFKVTCKNNSYTSVTAFVDQEYYVLDIFYDNQSLIVTSVNFVDQQCPLPYINITTVTNFYPLSVSPLNTEVYFLLNCSDHHNLTGHEVSWIDCYPNNSYFGGEYNRFSNHQDFANAGCTLLFEPVLNYSRDYSYRDILSNGWLLSWSAVDCQPCLESSGRCGFNETTSKFMCICADGVHSNTCGSSTSKRKQLVWAITISLLLGFFLLSCVIVAVRVKRNRAAKSIVIDSEDPLLHNTGVDVINILGILPSYGLSTIKAATNDFSDENKLGEGGFGVVYKGQLQDGQKIAVKKLSRYSSSQGPNEFQNEISLIAKLQHRNLVRLLGSCIEGDERLIVLEYMENKSLDAFIYDKTRSSLLNWQKRLEIIIGIARGLLYLHQDSVLRVIHRDLKPSNILLDKDMIPKISDFGIARIFEGDGAPQNATTRPIGTIGYMAPEYLNEGVFSFKSDVYSFGVIVLEILSGKRNRITTDTSLNLIQHTYKLWKEGRSLEILDDVLDCSYPTTEILSCIRMSLLCVQDNIEDRPTMAEIVTTLANEDQLQTPSKEPTIISTAREEHFTTNEMSFTITSR